MCEFNCAETRLNAINLLRIFNRDVFKEEYLQLKATNVLTKNILNNIKLLNLEKNDIILLKNDKFKDILFILLKNNLNSEELKPLTHYAINDKFINSLLKIKYSIVESLVGESENNYDEISNILISFIDYAENIIENEI